MNQRYIKMNLIEPIVYLLKHWWFILILSSLTSGVAYYVTTQFIEPSYKASATLFIGKENNGLTELNFNDLQVGSQLVMDYQQLIQTDLIAEQVISNLGLSISVEHLKENLEAEIIESSRFMRISYKEADPLQARQIANTLSDVLAEKAIQIVGVQNIQIVDYAKVPQKSITTYLPFNVFIGCMIGFIMGIMIVIMQMLLNTTIQEEEEIESGFGLPVLGVIPKLKGRVNI